MFRPHHVWPYLPTKALVATGALLLILLLKNAARTTMIVNENQNSATIDQHYIGWYLWIGAQIVAIAAISVFLVEPRMMGLISRADSTLQDPSHEAV